MKSVILGLLLSIPLLISAQNITNLHDDKGFYCDYTIVDGDTVFMMYLDEVYIWGNKSFRNSAESRQWNRLVKNVKTVYPYAKLAGIKFNEYSHEIADITSDKRKKELMSKAEDELQAQFGNELKELTF